MSESESESELKSKSKSSSFDFKEQTKTLLKRIGQNSGAPIHPALAQAAVEALLREAYTQGAIDARTPRAPKATQTAFAAKLPAQATSSPECAHEWEEVFLDGRTLGNKCIDCGILQTDLQARCEHYFVQVGTGESCVACRKSRRPR